MKRSVLCLLAAVLAAAGCAVKVANVIVPSSKSTAYAGDNEAFVNAGFLIPPASVRELGYRIDYQTRTFPEAGAGIKTVSVQGDSVFVLDGRNFLTRLRRDDGERLWRIPVGDPLDNIYGITYLADLEWVLLTVGSNLLILDDDTGSLIDKQQFGQIASTAPIVFGPLLIYGSRNGQLVWHSYEIGHQWRGYEVAPSIRLTPLLVGNDIAVIGTDGTVMVLDGPSAAGLWQKRLLNAVAAEPVAGYDLLYIAGLDQYVWALDIRSGRTVWRHLSESPLTDSPVLIADRLFQQIPTEGLVCFEADPVDAPGGVIRWSAPDVGGNVIGRNGHRLLVWNDKVRQMTLVDEALGSTITTVALPRVSTLLVSDLESGDLYAAGNDGRIIRMVPRN